MELSLTMALRLCVVLIAREQREDALPACHSSLNQLKTALLYS